MAASIRSFRAGDAPALCAITIAAIREIGPRAYSAGQVDAWAARHMKPERFVERAKDGAAIGVAVEEDDRPVAYLVLEQADATRGHVDMLYCHPAHTRQGIADALLAHAEADARGRGLRLVYTEASELARAAFARAGYAELHRRDFEIEHDGHAVPIHNYAMEKRLW